MKQVKINGHILVAGDIVTYFSVSSLVQRVGVVRQPWGDGVEVEVIISNGNRIDAGKDYIKEEDTIYNVR